MRSARDVAQRSALPLASEDAPLDERVAMGHSESPETRYAPLVPLTRLVPALRRQLSAEGSGAVDARRLVRAIAELRPIRQLPRTKTTRWNAELVVVLDYAQRLMPYRADLNGLARMLRTERGREGTSLRVFNRGPHGGWTELAGKGSGVFQRARPWQAPAPGTAVLLATDLGILRGAGSVECRAWQDFTAELVRKGCQPVALVPLGAGQLFGSLFPGVRLLRWSPDSSLRPEHGCGACRPDVCDGPLPDGLGELLGMVATATRVDPPLLRALRSLTAGGARNAGLEGALWDHPDVVAGVAAGLCSGEASERHLATFRAMPIQRRVAVAEAIERDHSHLRAAVVAHETLRLSTNGGRVVVSAEMHARALSFARRLVATLRESTPQRVDMEWVRVAQDWLAQADSEMVEAHGDLYHAIVRELDRLAAPSGKRLRTPGWIDPARRTSPSPESRPSRLLLVEAANGEELRVSSGSLRLGETAFGAALALDGRGFRVRTVDAQGVPSRWSSEFSDGDALPAVDRAAAVELETASERLRIQTILRPRGAEGWGRRRGGLFVQTAAVCGKRGEWDQAGLAFQPMPAADAGAAREDGTNAASVAVVTREPMRFDLGRDSHVAFGIDAEFGVYADLSIAGLRENVVQRFRWMEPGEFMMGSPATELERMDREGPQHRTVLTRGYWLGDTACTQALWRAVMGTDPSRFKGAERPVEQVSWTEVKEFLQKLEHMFPGSGAALPTEAEWEYACRAGTRTPFWFGETITPEQVNYDGNLPYAEGKKGVYRKETVEVKSLPANGWGMHEMHGNVWEWCRDGLREYTPEEVEDPVGPEVGDVNRVVRGGSWGGLAGLARSACRFAYPPGGRDGDLGFRFSLRSLGPVPRGAGQAEEAEPSRGAGSAPGGPRSGPAEPGGRGAQEGVLRRAAKWSGTVNRDGDTDLTR